MSTPGRRRANRLQTAALAGLGFGIAAWVGAATLMSDRGLDTSDEGFYLLSYRWWDSTPRVFTGVQYIYGPVLDAVGDSVPALRLVRLVSVIALHATLGWAVVTWLRARGAPRRLSPSGELVAVGAITAAGAVQYGWLPLSPGYNDVAVLTSLGLVAALLRCMRAAHLGRPLPVLPAVAAGLCATLLVVAKWSSAALVLALVVVVGAIALRRLGARGWIRFLLVGLGSVLFLGAGFLSMAGGTSVISTIVDVNKLAARTGNSPAELVRMYLNTGAHALGQALLLAVPALVCVGVGRVLSTRGAVRSAAIVLVLAPITVPFVAWPSRWAVPLGGAANVERYTAVLIALGALAAGAAVLNRKRSGADLPDQASEEPLVLVLLLLAPLVQAIGTGNALYLIAVNAFGCWVAALVILGAGLDGALRVVARTATAVAVAVCLAVGTSGLLEIPYRTSSYADSDQQLGGKGITAGLRVGKLQARILTEVQQAAGNPGRGTPILGFDEMAGFVLALDGRSVGEAWYSALDHHRTRVGIEDACSRPNPFAGRRPVVLFDRDPEPEDLTALRSCGIDLGVGYRLVLVPFLAGKSILVYRPIEPRERS
ncbi:hypothetical protein [Nocardioides marmorisolisilvae]|uniref:Glycosyltransferase RgtA/B/C/D-like domain-containing protein n=1 Tax=Nocardioides marmorisolisilvae TaxID=1542737 RepID=A0A3N0DTW0_9ACTN|nr:hypothetical protein [Nocardioides marmorisolisilvae]RNL79065.1 hypothetical protein EFL95_08485 [Nocardioides marmorisolisilvae]